MNADYIKTVKSDYSTSIRNSVKHLISAKKISTEIISNVLSNKTAIISIMQKKDYKKFYNKKFRVFHQYNFQKLAIHIIDAKGKQRYMSWTHKTLGQDILHARKDLKELLLKPHNLTDISVGKFDITIKSISPIYSNNRKLLGLFEVIASFNSIEKILKKDNLFSAIIVNKKYAQQLKNNSISKRFVDGYYISNLTLNNNIEKLLKNYGIKEFINIKKFGYIVPKKNIITGYFVYNIPLFNEHKKLIAHYLVFKYDEGYLYFKELLSYLLVMTMFLLFLVMTYFVYKENKRAEKLIQTLDEKVKNQVKKYMKAVYTDSLTKVFSKIKLKKDVSTIKDSEAVMLNIRNFSQINNAYSYQIGDNILIKTAQQLKNILKTDIYRISVDEFVFFSSSFEEDIQKIKNIFINNPIKLNKNNIRIRISFSFGVSKIKDNNLLRNLSIALKESKNHPYFKYIYYKEQETTNKFLKFNTYLYDAIYNEGKCKIVPYFQGIRDNKTKKINKYECLARLIVADKVFTPYYFIDIAKNSGFIHEVTKIMIDKSFKYLNEQKDKNIEISLNITEHDLESGYLREYLATSLQKYNLQTSLITLEILENVTNQGAKNNIKQLDLLKADGFKLAIDDFGIEYSNFERIASINIDIIKIDGKYIKMLDKDEKSYKITKAITDFAHSLNIQVVAEFVEDELIQNKVEELGIDYTQGYYYSTPHENINQK